MAMLPTLTVKIKGKAVRINETDFDIDQHELYDGIPEGETPVEEVEVEETKPEVVEEAPKKRSNRKKKAD